MRGRPNQSHDAFLEVAALVVNQQPIGLDVALARTDVFTGQLVVEMLFTKRTIVQEFLDDCADFYPVVTPGPLDTLLVGLELAGLPERPRHSQKSSSVVLVV